MERWEIFSLLKGFPHHKDVHNTQALRIILQHLQIHLKPDQ